jgi:hypothetical protein
MAVFLQGKIMTLPAYAYRDPSEIADANIEKEKRDAAFKKKMADRHRIYKSRKHRAQVKHLMKQGGH